MRENIREIDANVDKLLKNVHCRRIPAFAPSYSLVPSVAHSLRVQPAGGCLWSLCVPGNETVHSTVGFNDMLGM